MKILSSKKRVAAIGVVTAATLVGGGMAYAYWTTTGEGDGYAQTDVGDLPYEVNFSSPVGDALAPGEGEQTVQVTVKNPDTGTRRLSEVAVSIADVNGDPWAVTVGGFTCDADDFRLNGAAAGASVDLVSTFLDIEGGQTSADMPVAVTMVNKPTDNQDVCKNVTVPLYASVS